MNNFTLVYDYLQDKGEFTTVEDVAAACELSESEVEKLLGDMIEQDMLEVEQDDEVVFYKAA